MAINTTVRWFHSSMAGAPQIMGVAGELIAILDACLLTGFAVKSVSTLVVTGGVATATIPSGCDFEVYSVVNITGASIAELNGDWRVTAATGTSVSFAATGIADGTATGTMTIKRSPPPSWQKPFSTATAGAYRSTRVGGTGCYFYIDDSITGASQYNTVRGYENMTAIDAGVRPFPVFDSTTTSFTWKKTNTTTAAQLPRKWTLVADDGLFYFLPEWSNGYAGAEVFFFGDLSNGAPTDFFNCVLSAEHSNPTPSYPHHTNSVINIYSGNYYIKSPRAIDNIEQSTSFSMIIMGYPLTSGAQSGGLAGSAGGAYPSPYSAGHIFASNLPVIESVSKCVRGIMSGFMQPLVNLTSLMTANNRVLLAPSETGGDAVLLVRVSVAGIGNYAVGFNISGSWR